MTGLTKGHDRMVAGVCSGFAEHFGWNVTWTRLIFALLVIFTLGLPGIVAYVVAAIIMPEPGAKKVN